jgi:hypothetical protein
LHAAKLPRIGSLQTWAAALPDRKHGLCPGASSTMLNGGAADTREATFHDHLFKTRLTGLRTERESNLLGERGRGGGRILFAGLNRIGRSRSVSNLLAKQARYQLHRNARSAASLIQKWVELDDIHRSDQAGIVQHFHH